MWLVNSNESTILQRRSIPNKFDHAQHKTICHVIQNNGNCDVYMQMSHNEDKPEWLYIESIPQKSSV